MPRKYTNYSKTSKTPRRPFEKERLDNEMKVVGEFGLKNKREVWRVSLLLAKMRANARMLLTLDEKNSKRIFEGNALLRRCVRLGLLEEDKRELDYVLAIKVGDIMARRLQTLVFKQNLAKSLHHARVLIRQRHIRLVSPRHTLPAIVRFAASAFPLFPLSLLRPVALLIRSQARGGMRMRWMLS